MNRVNLKKTVIFAAILNLSGVGVCALAQESTVPRDDILSRAPAVQIGREYRSESVDFRDLNLASPAGIRTLYGRIDVAAKKVCQPEPDIRNMVMHRDWEACYAGALDRGVSAVQLPALNRYHLVQTGRLGEQEEQVSQAH